MNGQIEFSYITNSINKYYLYMELHQIRVFVALAEEASMIRAASRLSVSQPSISFTLAALERELGYVLFLRSTRRLTMTERGRELLDRARILLQVAGEIEHSGHVANAKEGVLRIAGRQGFMQYVFPFLAAKLAKVYPNITIERATSADQKEVVEALRVGSADIAFAASPNVKAITAEILHEDAVWLAVDSGDAIAARRMVSLSAIAELDLCLPLSTDRLRKPIEVFLKKLPKRPRVVLETNDYTLMKNMIARGQCAGFIYAHMLVGEKGQGVTPLKIEALHLKRDLTILHRRDDLLPHVELARTLFIEESRKLLTSNARRFEKRK
jgi:DNA-binding transcriptional LysR family regulator